MFKKKKERERERDAAGKKLLLLLKNLSKFKQCLRLVPYYLAGSLLGRESCLATMSEGIKTQRSLARSIVIHILLWYDPPLEYEKEARNQLAQVHML